MLPSLISREITDAIRQQLSAQFPSTTQGFLRTSSGGGGEPRAVIDQLLDKPGQVLKGPYLSFGLPFRVANDVDKEALGFSHVDLEHPPYAHQLKAFQRLLGHAPQPTLVATGTGSGKTECFMYPLLEHCASVKAPGVKALVIYPMNALAQDQARRFAEEVDKQSGLKGKVTVGLYTGDSAGGRKVMSRDSVMTDRDAMKKNPPDILLTNYKMLDFLLIRPGDKALWRFNTPDMLRYLVVDELHTFDGAQGTDLACLIRRLKDRLEVDEQLACVGTSATVGDDLAALTSYASNVFDTRFGDDAVLREERLSAEEFLAQTSSVLPAAMQSVLSPAHSQAFQLGWPDTDAVSDFAGRRYQSQTVLLDAAAELWFWDNTGEGVDGKLRGQLDASEPAAFALACAALLPRLPAFRELLDLASDIIEKSRVVANWQQRWQVPVMAAELALDALIALVATARDPAAVHEGVSKRPWVMVREQLWLRELRRMVATVSAEPELRFRDDLYDDRVLDVQETTAQYTAPGLSDNAEAGAITLPVVHCNACHATGWLSRRRPTGGELIRDVRQIYDAFFNENPDTVAIYPHQNPPAVKHFEYALCNQCGSLNPMKSHHDQLPCVGRGCAATHYVPVVVPHLNRNASDDGASRSKFRNACPYCETRDALFILGSRAATLSSVAINCLFNSPFNDHPKLIAFSDSVQDAAHRAGFFSARTWSGCVRQALGMAIHSGEFTNLQELINNTGSWWHTRFLEAGQTDADFVATFLAPDLAWLNDWEELQRTDKLLASSTLVNEWVLPRLRWEVLMAFGQRARVGRTLERTGVAAVYPDLELLANTVDACLPQIQEQLVHFRDLDHATLRRFAQGVLWTMRTHGALFDAVLEGFIHSGGDVYSLTNRRMRLHLPRLGSRSPLPRFLGLRQQKSSRKRNQFDAVINKTGISWFAGWFNKVLAVDEALFGASEVEQFYTLLMRAAVRNGLVNAHELVDKGRGETTLWSLNPEHWQLSTNVVVSVCSVCRHQVQIADEARDDWQGSPCLRVHCSGVQGVSDLGGDDVDAVLDQQPRRLVSAEHTAVLDGPTRAQVEQSFKRHPPKLWDINLLSATPTMEMGVDIGDLSSVLLCSVPPAQANYLQRIGRAGRKDGNAFNLTIAAGVPHDLYFYSDPLEMMRGHVQPPGVFLDAISVLERQLFAYCLDRWVQDGVEDDAIPARLATVLDAVDQASERLFPNNFFDYVDRERGVLLQDFCKLFRPLVRKRRQVVEDESAATTLFSGLDTKGINQLSEFLQGSYNRQSQRPGITVRLVQLFETKAKQRKRLRREIEQLKRDTEKLERQPVDEARDEQLAEVRAERAAIQRLVRVMNRQQTLQFLTDEGVLPNYAFPEEGVKLNSVIFRRRDTAQSDDDGSSYDKIELELRRPAHTALRELAPHSQFYGNSRQVRIDQVMVDKDDVEEWRFCPGCNFGENVSLRDEFSTCPRCGHAGWPAAEQRMRLLKLREVYANASDKDSRIGDDSDDREPVFFTRQYLFDLDPVEIQKSWQIEVPECPFGYEFLQKATFREINFGRVADTGPEIEVAGTTMARAGFPVCIHCGKVRMWRPRTQQNHTRRCKMFDADDETQKHPDNLWQALYLYRELSSEAIRILLPLADIAHSEVRLQSFIAALHLGLKRRFHGNVDHLQITYVSEPVSGGSLRRHFLILLDTVPGGTGYLAELARDTGSFHRMLVSAQQALTNCGCTEDADADGCYRCLFAYRQSHELEQISRKAALSTLQQVLEHWEHLGELPDDRNLNHTDVNALYDSELERRFIDALSGAPGCNLLPQRIGTKYGFELTISNQGFGDSDTSSEALLQRTVRWEIEPQVDLGPEQGVALHCRPDFVMRCLSASNKDVLPIAVFTDGFEYHRDSVADDTAKRLAISQSGKYMTWTVTWHDLPTLQDKNQLDVTSWFRQPVSVPVIEKIYDPAASVLHWPNYSKWPDAVTGSVFDHLLALLRNPLGNRLDVLHWAVARVFGLVDTAKPVDQVALQQQVGTWLPVPWREQHLVDDSMLGISTLPSDPLVTGVAVIPRADLAVLSAATQAASSSVELADTLTVPLPKLALSLCLRLDDSQIETEGYRDSWNRFWAMVNVLQVLPHFLAVSHTGLEGLRYAELLEPGESQQALKVSIESDKEIVLENQAWQTVFEHALDFDESPDALCELAALVSNSTPEPLIGKDLKIGDEVIANASWAWLEHRLALVDAEGETTADEIEALTKDGWRLITNPLTASLTQLAAWLAEKGD